MIIFFNFGHNYSLCVIIYKHVPTYSYRICYDTVIKYTDVFNTDGVKKFYETYQIYPAVKNR